MPPGDKSMESSSARIPPEISTQLRAVAHDLANSLETITQASYLLANMQIDDSARRWAQMIDQASRDAIRLNRQLREILRSSMQTGQKTQRHEAAIKPPHRRDPRARRDTQEKQRQRLDLRGKKPSQAAKTFMISTARGRKRKTRQKSRGMYLYGRPERPPTRREFRGSSG